MAKVRMLKTTSWEDERFEAGATGEVADDVAERWASNGIAEYVAASPPPDPKAANEPSRGRRTAPAASAEPADEEE